MESKFKHADVEIMKIEKKKKQGGLDLQSVTKYLRLTLVFT